MVTIATPNDQLHNVGDTVSLAVVASGSGPLRYSATGLPNGLSINIRTGVISGTLRGDGVFPATVTATQGTASACAAFTWSVASLSTIADAGGPLLDAGAATAVPLAATGSQSGPLTFLVTTVAIGNGTNPAVDTFTWTVAG